MAMIKCPECGKEVSDKADKCPNCGYPLTKSLLKENNNINQNIPKPEAQKTSEKKKESICGIIGMIIALFALFGANILLAVVAIILCIGAISGKTKKSTCGAIGMGIGVFALIVSILAPQYLKYVQKSKEASNIHSETISENLEINNTTETQKENTEEKDIYIKNETAKAEKKDKYNVGDTWENKYVLVSYDKCGEYISDNQFIQPADGNKYIYATFTFENIGTSDTTVGSWDFDCYADGYACEGTYAADDAAFSQSLSSGRKISGSVYFEVPKDAQDIEFEYSPNFWTSEKIVFVYEE